MRTLAEEFGQSAVLTRDWLSRVDLHWGSERLIDISKGIWNSRSYAATLTIVSDPRGRYDDGHHGESLYRYSYERQPPGQDPRGGSNAKLREAMRLQLPIIMLLKIDKSQFVPIMPVYVVKDEPQHQRFLLALDESLRFLRDPAHLTEDERRYAERVVRRRVHQPEFRSRVLKAYEVKCAVCELKKGPLLDAAHPRCGRTWVPVVTNGRAVQDPPRGLRREDPWDLAGLPRPHQLGGAARGGRPHAEVRAAGDGRASTLGSGPGQGPARSGPARGAFRGVREGRVGAGCSTGWGPGVRSYFAQGTNGVLPDRYVFFPVLDWPSSGTRPSGQV